MLLGIGPCETLFGMGMGAIPTTGKTSFYAGRRGLQAMYMDDRVNAVHGIEACADACIPSTLGV
jgi:hypothetical protein